MHEFCDACEAYKKAALVFSTVIHAHLEICQDDRGRACSLTGPVDENKNKYPPTGVARFNRWCYILGRQGTPRRVQAQGVPWCRP